MLITVRIAIGTLAAIFFLAFCGHPEERRDEDLLLSLVSGHTAAAAQRGAPRRPPLRARANWTLADLSGLEMTWDE
jgi:hypothetical protein